jgi:hypothetical protein
MIDHTAGIVTQYLASHPLPHENFVRDNTIITLLYTCGPLLLMMPAILLFVGFAAPIARKTRIRTVAALAVLFAGITAYSAHMLANAGLVDIVWPSKASIAKDNSQYAEQLAVFLQDPSTTIRYSPDDDAYILTRTATPAHQQEVLGRSVTIPATRDTILVSQSAASDLSRLLASDTTPEAGREASLLASGEAPQ